MKRVLLSVGAFVIAAVSAIAPVMASDTAKDAVTTYTLKNGMDVVVIKDHRAPVAVHMVWYKAGSADETPSVSGVAHFLEHLLFKGTKTVEPGEFSAIVARNGGMDNAFTSYDFTGYFQRVAKDRLELMMQMESDRMVNLQLDEDDIATERDVIIEERNQRTENNPFALFSEQMNAAQYLNHRYGVPVIGWQREMVSLGLQDALDYYKKFYAPNNAILVVAGDVAPQEVLTLAEKYYAPLPANPELGPRQRPQEPRQMAARRLVMEDARVAQPYVVRSYMAPERNANDQKEAAALTILAELLGGGSNSLLTQKLQFDTQKAVYSAAAYDGSALDQTTFDIYIGPAEGVTMQDAEDAMDKVLTEFLQNGVDTEHMQRIKTQLRAAQIYARDDVRILANEYGQALTQGLTIEDVQSWPEILNAVTEEDVMAIAKKIFVPETSVTGWLQGTENS